MRKNFSWESFSVPFLKSICFSEKTLKKHRPRYETDDKDSLLAYMNRIAPQPDAEFVTRYRPEIMDHFLAGSTHLINIVRNLEKNRYRGVHMGDLESMMDQIKRLRLTSTVMTLILGELYRAGARRIGEDSDLSIFVAPKKIDLAACIPGDLPMYDYQQEALQHLMQHFCEENCDEGILVMPTGSGKTRVATRFLLESMVAAGWQVLWLTHRAMLIEQTASSVYLAAGGLLKKTAPDKETFRMICVSGSHASPKAMEKEDDVMICGVQSLVRNLDYLPAVLKSKVLIVVDEAHHALAPTYRTIIKKVKELAEKTKILGLTATPVRMNERDTMQLMLMFGGKVIYSVPMSTLIAKGSLADPHYERIDTHIEFDTTVSLDQQKYIRKWGELSPDMMEQMAQMAERNALIADTYVRGKEHYGKTLIFALNATHCISLCEELQSRGVRCDYIYCAHPGNAEKIARFQRNELDVLVNIQVLTEGSDVPDIQSVFLTRPTTSDVLLMQMIGRGMRGTGSGGTSTVNIVDFHDNWGSFANWLNPEFLFDRAEDAEKEGDPAKKADRAAGEVPWGMFRDILDSIHVTYADDGKAEATLPAAWINVMDEEGNDSHVLIFESQLNGYMSLMCKMAKDEIGPDYTGEDALREWFDGFGMLPSVHDLQRVIDTQRMTDDFTMFFFKEREQVDAALVARRLKEANTGLNDLEEQMHEVYREHSAAIDSLYGSREAYETRVWDFIRYRNGAVPLGMQIEEMAEEQLPFRPEPCYDLDELVQEVVDEQFDGVFDRIPPVSWTRRAYRGYFGQYVYDPAGAYIRINCMLNSPDVPRETVKYVIYHELLHRDLRRHDAVFRQLEHQYPAWTEHERFLDVTFPKFDKQSAM